MKKNKNMCTTKKKELRKKKKNVLKIKKPFTLITTSDGDLDEVKIIDRVSEDIWEALKHTNDSVLMGFPEDYCYVGKSLNDWSLENSQNYFGIWGKEEKHVFDELREDHKWFGEIFEWVD